MAERPITFSAPMVRALLDGRKAQTRRLLRNSENYGCPTGDCPHETQAECNTAMASLSAKEVGFAIGDSCYVREAWRVHASFDAMPGSELEALAPRVWPEVDRDNCDAHGRYRHARFMPRWASRLTLFVDAVRVQRLQDITEADAVAEGVRRLCEDSKYDTGPNHFTVETGGLVGGSLNAPTARETYALLWDCLHENPGTRWHDNPWIYALTFRVARGNIDQLAA